MKQRKSSVNFRNLIRDLAEMYPFDISEVVLTELVANSLDARSTTIEINYDPKLSILIVSDNGSGMNRSQFSEYHDFAAGLKLRGTGIGFAGVGAKISFNAANRVVTETRSKKFEGASDWYFNRKGELVWESARVQALSGLGTRVAVHFVDPKAVNFRTREDIVSLLKKHYLPLLEPRFRKLYSKLNLYPEIEFIVNGGVVVPGLLEKDFEMTNVKEIFPKQGAKRIGFGIFGLAKEEYPLGPERVGVLLCTYGKIIRAESFSAFPGKFGPRIVGLVEITELVRFLTTSKTDFNKGKSGTYRRFLGLVEPIKVEYLGWLAELGVLGQDSRESGEAIQLERELRKLLEYFPELSDFFGTRNRAAVLSESPSGLVEASAVEGSDVTYPVGDGDTFNTLGPSDVGDEPGQSLEVVQDGVDALKAAPISRSAKRGPRVSFVEQTEREELGWVDGNTILVNLGHPAYVRFATNNAARHLYHLAAISVALQRFFLEQGRANCQDYPDRMLGAWAREQQKIG